MFSLTSVCVSVYISSQNILYTNHSIYSHREYIRWMLPMTIFIRMYSLQFCFNNSFFFPFFFIVYIHFHRQHICCVMCICIYRICYGYSWYDELLYAIRYTRARIYSIHSANTTTEIRVFKGKPKIKSVRCLYDDIVYIACIWMKKKKR